MKKTTKKNTASRDGGPAFRATIRRVRVIGVHRIDSHGDDDGWVHVEIRDGKAALDEGGVAVLVDALRAAATAAWGAPESRPFGVPPRKGLG